MFKENYVRYEQESLLSKVNDWSEYKRKRIEKGWPRYFRSNILPNIEESDYKVIIFR